MPEKNLKPKIVAVRLNDTKGWCPEILSKVKAINSHYIFNENEVTRCCELTPSYWLRWVGFDIEMKDPAAYVPDSLHEEISDAFLEMGVEKDVYMHCHVIGRLEEPDRIVFMEDMESDEGGNLDEAYEAWSANPLW